MDKSELLQLQTNANQQDNSTSSKLITRLQIEDTPFWVVGNKEKGYGIVLGKYRVSEMFGYDAKDDDDLIHGAMSFLDQNKWNITFHMIAALIQQKEEAEKDTNK